MKGFGLFFVFCFSVSALSAQTGRISVPPKVLPSSYLKRQVGCNAFELKKFQDGEIKALKILPRDSLVLPANFPAPPANAKSCGCRTLENTVYYISKMGERGIFNYYENKLRALGFNVSDVTPGIGPDDFIMQFSSKAGTGSVYTYGDKYAYYITYKDSKAGCNCSRKD